MQSALGLWISDDVIAGVVYEIGKNETFTAWKNGGAWLNGKPVHVSEVDNSGRQPYCNRTSIQ